MERTCDVRLGGELHACLPAQSEEAQAAAGQTAVARFVGWGGAVGRNIPPNSDVPAITRIFIAVAGNLFMSAAQREITALAEKLHLQVSPTRQPVRATALPPHLAGVINHVRTTEPFGFRDPPGRAVIAIDAFLEELWLRF